MSLRVQELIDKSVNLLKKLRYISSLYPIGFIIFYLQH